MAPWVLFSEQEPYYMVSTGIYGIYIYIYIYMIFMLYKNLNYTNLGYKVYTTILKNHIKKS